MAFLILATVSLISSIIYYALSGSAEGFASARALLTIPLLVANLWGLVAIVRVAYLKIAKNAVVARSRIFLAACALLALGDFTFWAAVRFDRRMVLATQVGGDRILEQATQYRDAKGAYPVSLNELRAAGFAVPDPALKNTVYQLSTEGGEAQISFDSTAFNHCRRSAQTAWVCDD